MKRRIRRLEALFLATTLAFAAPCSKVIFGAPGSVDEIQNQVDQAEQKVLSMEEEMAGILAKIYDSEAKMVELGEEILQAEEELQKIEEAAKKQNETMKLRIRAMYESGDSSMLEMIFEGGSLSETLKRAENVQTIHEYDRKELQAYLDNLKKIKVMKASLEADMKEQKSYKSEYEAQKAKLATALESERAKAADLEVQLAEAQKKAEEEARRQAALREQERLRKEAEKKAREEAKKKEENKKEENKPQLPGKQEETVEPPKGNTSTAQAIVNAAYGYLGTPYVWGGTSYSGIDCSGLTMMCHRAAGISIPRVSYSQAASGQKVGSLENALPGDVICYPGHVAIYIGNKQVIHAPTEGQNVKVASVYMGPSQPITAIRRYW